MANQVLKGTIKVVYNDTLYDVHPKTEFSEVEGNLDASVISGNLSNASINGSNITGTVATSKLNGTLSAASISGTLGNATISGNNVSGGTIKAAVPAASVTGTLSNATINGSKVSGGTIAAAVPAASVSGTLSGATIDGSHISGTVATSKLSGTLSGASISGALASSVSIAGSKITGNVPASIVSGTLSGATIDGSHISGTVATSKLSGTLSGASISGALASSVSIAGSKITGNVPASIVSGTLSGASIEAANVIGLENYSGSSGSGTGKRFGYRISKSEADPYNRVTYIHDAANMTPAHMDFKNDAFDFGDWGSTWFVKNIKPVMLKADGTVDYYLYQNDYTKKAEGNDVTTNSGVDSDLANSSYSGTDNAMVQFPLIYVRRVETPEYIEEVICDYQYDDTYHAYAHTNASGNVLPYFYYSMFDGSGSQNSIRSLPSKTVSKSLTASQQIQGAVANGTGWYIHSWSQRELIRTLCILLGKSTDTQTRFGTGRATGSGGTDSTITTGTLMNKGMFYGISANTSAVKVFHIENFWGNQWDRTAGLILNYTDGYVYVKMTPEGEGYRTTDTNGMTKTTAVPATGEEQYVQSCKAAAEGADDFGVIPVGFTSGSSSTYYCDGYWRRSGSAYPSGNIGYLIAGGGSDDASSLSGAFAFSVGHAPSSAPWSFGCGLSYIAS